MSDATLIVNNKNQYSIDLYTQLRNEADKYIIKIPTSTSEQKDVQFKHDREERFTHSDPYLLMKYTVRHPQRKDYAYLTDDKI